MRGAVIAGGGATRYGGAPKGLVSVGGRRLLDRVVDALIEATGTPPLLVANAPGAETWRPGLIVQPDVLEGQGSLGGILTAVEADGRTDGQTDGQTVSGVLCVAWDMPFVPAGLLKELAALLEGADAAVPESDGPRGLEPLCAAYGPACGPAIRAALARGDQRAIGFHRDIRLARLARARVLQYGDPDILFFNVNTPDDLSRAEQLCRVPGSSR
jgi:molybdopterin-guanine dinucleotide biosynthesis protein A